MTSLHWLHDAVLTVMPAARPPFAPVHFLSLIFQVLYLVCEFPDVLSIFFLSLAQPASVSLVRRWVDRAWLLQVSVDRSPSLLREACPGHRESGLCSLGRHPSLSLASLGVTCQYFLCLFICSCLAPLYGRNSTRL